jgi:uncharacterized membrane protein
MGTQYTYSGPLPHPEILEHYDRIVPGGAERIFAQFESQSLHRQRIEYRVIRSNSFVQIFGAISALILGLAAIGGGLFLVYKGKSIEGFGAFFTGLASLVGVYIYGKVSQSSERKSKQG